MKAGTMRHAITFRKVTVTINEGGTPIQDQVTTWTVRAALIEETANEDVGDTGAEDLAKVKFHLRFDDEVTAACDLTFRSESYNIKRITPQNRGREMLIEAQKVGGIE